ncbi:MAG: PEP-CTERM sorting domain-containing protein [bacterium]
MTSRFRLIRRGAVPALAVMLSLAAAHVSAARASHNAPVGTLGSASFSGLGDLPGGAAYSFATSVSGDGTTAVGWSRSRAGASSFEAFVWTASGGMTGLGDLLAGDPKSQARDVSFDGSIVVGEARGASGTVGFRWTAATGMEALLDSAGAPQRGQAFSVSSDGSTIAGVRVTAVGNEAFRWTAAGGFGGLGWLPVPNDPNDSFAFGVSSDGSVICGCSYSFVGTAEPFRWTAASGLVGLGDVPGGQPYAIAYAISDDGSTIAGNARANTLGADEAFVWSEAAGFVFPDTLRGTPFESAAAAASADGAIVVGYANGSAMIWDAQNGARSIAAILTNDFGLDLTGWTLWIAQGVSADGEVVVGFGTNPAGTGEAWIARIPRDAVLVGEPGDTGDHARRPGAALELRITSANPFRDRVEFTLRGGADDRLGASGFESAASSEPARVRVEIFGADGRRVRALVSSHALHDAAGLAWDARDDRGRAVPAGVYFLRAATDADTARPATRKLTRVR